MGENQLVRQWKILRALESNRYGLTVSELANLTHQHQRTMYRDLAVLVEAGFPIYNDRSDGRSKWLQVNGHHPRFSVPLTVNEIMSLQLARDALGAYKGSVFHECVEKAFDKIERGLSSPMLDYLQRTHGAVTVKLSGSKEYAHVREISSSVLSASLNRIRIEIIYQAVSTGDETTRIIDPHQLLALENDLYVIGYCHLKNAVRTFALDRIKSVKLLKENFEKITESVIQEHRDAAFRIMSGQPQKVRLRISSSVSHTVRERKWHPSQQLREMKNGSIVVTLTVPITHEIISWILSYGSKAVVIEPGSLRTRIVKELKDMSKRYKLKDAKRS